MGSWNGLDFFIFLILTINTVLGMSRGATKEIISTMCLSAALIGTIKFTVPLATFFNSSPIMNNVVDNKLTQNFMMAIGAGHLTAGLLIQTMYSISLLICFVGVFSLCEAGLSVTGFIEAFSFPYALLNRKVGGSLGFLRGYIISLIFLVIVMLHVNIGRDFLAGSFFVNLFQSQAQTLDNLITSRNAANYNQLYQNQPYNEQNLYKALSKPEIPLPTSQPQAPQAPASPQTQPQTPSPSPNQWGQY